MAERSGLFEVKCCHGRRRMILPKSSILICDICDAPPGEAMNSARIGELRIVPLILGRVDVRSPWPSF